MRSPSDFYPYQLRGVHHILQHPNSMLWEFMGAGKTIQILTAADTLLDQGKVTGVLVVAPKRVIQLVWRQEAAGWTHTRHLSFSLVQGSPEQRQVALRRKVQIYLVNYENLPWLVAQVTHLWIRHGRYPPFQMLVLDEITKVKNSQAARTKELLRIISYFTRRVGLTGEPAANGFSDLFGQFLCVDGGQRLGASVTAFRTTYLQPKGYMGYSWEATESGRERIMQRISDITLVLREKDFLSLPPVLTQPVWVELPPKARKIYDKLEKSLFAELDAGKTLEVMFEAALINKLIQVASGAAYLVPGGEWVEIHRAKLEALEDMLEEAGGQPILLGYTFKHEATRIAQAFPERPQTHSGASFLSAKLPEREITSVLDRWKADQIPLLCGHPGSMGHGLDGLQVSSANRVAWFSLPWSLELFNQMNARLTGGLRRKRNMFICPILARDTVDELVRDTLLSKVTTQDGLKRAVHAYRERRGL